MLSRVVSTHPGKVKCVHVHAALNTLMKLIPPKFILRVTDVEELKQVLATVVKNAALFIVDTRSGSDMFETWSEFLKEY